MKEGRSNVKVIKMRQQLVRIEMMIGLVRTTKLVMSRSQSSSNTQEMGQKGKLAGGKRTKGQTCWQFYYFAELHVVQTVKSDCWDFEDRARNFNY